MCCTKTELMQQKSIRCPAHSVFSGFALAQSALNILVKGLEYLLEVCDRKLTCTHACELYRISSR